MKKQINPPPVRIKIQKESPSRFTALRPEFYSAVAEILRNARRNSYRVVNFTMVEAYWNIGRMIVEEEQQGKKRAEYGAFLLKELSQRLTREFGKGFDETNLRKMRQFYIVYQNQDHPRLESNKSEKRDTACLVSQSPTFQSLRRELTWSHYRLLMRVEKPLAREWYMNEAASAGWGVTVLKRQINSLYYERLLMSRDKAPVEVEASEKISALSTQPGDFIKDPYVLEFLGIPDAHAFRESELEQAIIAKLQKFMLELGKGFAFVARQYRVSTETVDFFVDLVFYNYLLKCFVLIDLKTGALAHQDIGQMDMYVRLFEDKMKAADDNPTVGLILCTEKDQTVVRYSVLNENRQLFASKYQLYLPTEEELRKELERERALVLREQKIRYG